MSSEPAQTVIRCEGIGKAFQLYMHRNDQLKQTLLGPFGHKFYKEHWVLRDVSFEVARGECVGIIGRNGAGKTTLLQILCGITAQTHGTASIEGRLAPILALGAGFDLDLTGRENVLIGGAILGLKKAEIVARMDSIAKFCDIGDFFYQPLRMYSSGMFARLAFSICAHADADILIVDEALSVGDQAFGAKCDAFIKDFARRGTILVVSHALETLEALCDRLVWIDDGRVRAIGTPSDLIPEYRLVMEHYGEE
ncbi:O-antigen export system ATP-binding protein RfbB [Beijerinckiaceae bacterium RH AL1]|jgi:lipopolysaccharide transport system ATP-binding protein|nr:ABC transporter ATP-binding protein [Beijerinckiaceae bacterium]VVB44312.1 O-antigen export system ATP-binding protein RfbB [Beijerinckiaceae bacterium RH CH11]VVB44391.1 O-antigen export system ATP-binding protein RfbB [Beijerinckiaceae bacterium RH AL8]VVC54291.1 O-antigen export system ATP-binding protein RfbB [Beijerinckiaceae bacterium RH AL1]